MRFFTIVFVSAGLVASDVSKPLLTSRAVNVDPNTNNVALYKEVGVGELTSAGVAIYQREVDNFCLSLKDAEYEGITKDLSSLDRVKTITDGEWGYTFEILLFRLIADKAGTVSQKDVDICQAQGKLALRKCYREVEAGTKETAGVAQVFRRNWANSQSYDYFAWAIEVSLKSTTRNVLPAPDDASDDEGNLTALFESTSL